MSIYEKLWSISEDIKEDIQDTGDYLQYALPIFFISYQACFGTNHVSQIFAVSLAVALLLMTLIKGLFNNPRPREVNTDDNPDLDLDWSPDEGNSFVSGHSTAAMCGGIWMFQINWLFGVLGVILALFVGFSRIVVKAHWLRDVLIAYLLVIINYAICVFYFL